MDMRSTTVALPYLLGIPVLDIGTSREKVSLGNFWKLQGVDGRYVGSFRRFPGFEAIIPYDDQGPGGAAAGRDGNTADLTANIDEVYLFKYAAIDKGQSDFSLRGFVWFGYQDGGSPEYKIQFLHYDTEESGWYAYDITSQEGNVWEAGDLVDVTSYGKYLVVNVRGKESITVWWDDGFTAYDDSGKTHNVIFSASTDELYLKKVDGEWVFVSDTISGDITDMALSSGNFTVYLDADVSDAYRVYVYNDPDVTPNCCYLLADGLEFNVRVATDTAGEYFEVGGLDVNEITVTAGPANVGVIAGFVDETAKNISVDVSIGTGHDIVIVAEDFQMKSVPSGPGEAPNDVASITLTATNALYIEDNKTVLVRYRWFDPERHLWTPYSKTTTLTNTSGGPQAVQMSLVNADIAARVAQGFTELWCYRSVNDGGTLFIEQVARFGHPYATPRYRKDYYDITLGYALSSSASNVYLGGDPANDSIWSDETRDWTRGLSDSALSQQDAIDPLYDQTGDPPNSGVVAGFAAGILAAGKPSDGYPDNGSTIRWSSLLSSGAENFPIYDHYYQPTGPSGDIKTIVVAGEFAYVVRSDAVLRISRSGSITQVSEVISKMGGEGRFGSTTVGNLLYVITQAGLLVVDGVSGTQDEVAAINRLLTDPTDYWATDLADLQLVYDGGLNALALSNPNVSEVYWLWLSTGAITSLGELPVQLTAEGIHPVDGGDHRAFFLCGATDGGPNRAIMAVDRFREEASQTLFPLDVRRIGSPVTSSTTWLQFSEQPASSWNSAAGFRIHYIGTDGNWYAAPITAINPLESRIYFEEQVSAPATGASGLYHIAPIVMEIGCAGFRGSADPDLWSKKIIRDMGFSVHVISTDEDLPAADNELEYRVYKGPRDNTPDKVQAVTIPADEDPTQMFKYFNVEGPQLYPAVYVRTANVDLELLGLQVRGTILGSEAQSQMSGS